MSGMPKVRALGFGPDGCSPLSRSQASILVGAQEVPELWIVVTRQALEPAPEVTPQHGYAADHRGMRRHTDGRHRQIVERRGAHEILSEPRPNPPGPDALLAGALRTQMDEADGL